MKKNYFFILVALLLASWVKAEAQEPATKGVANNFLWYKLIQAEEEKTLLQVPSKLLPQKMAMYLLLNCIIVKRETKSPPSSTTMLHQKATKHSPMAMMAKQLMAIPTSLSTK